MGAQTRRSTCPGGETSDCDVLRFLTGRHSVGEAYLMAVRIRRWCHRGGSRGQCRTPPLADRPGPNSELSKAIVLCSFTVPSTRRKT